MSERISIYVVDDEPDMLILLNDLLVGNRYDVKTFDRAKKLVLELRSSLPNIIIMDIMMPEMDGYELCRLIKDNPSLKDILICFLSAKATDSDIEKGLSMGADAYVTKPFNNRDLIIKVKELAKLSSSKKMPKQKQSVRGDSVMSTRTLLKENDSGNTP